MTREEAIAILEEEAEYLYQDDEPYNREAFRMAIQALSQEPTVQEKQAESEKYQKAFDDGYENGYAQARFDYEQEPCDDAIGRDAVLSIIDGWYEQNRETENIEDLIILITYMDSVTPKSRECEDVISRAEVKRIVDFYKEQYDGIYHINESIDNLPSVTQKSGKWILLDECANSGYYCSNCQKKLVKEGWSDTVKKIKFCPNCGARMVEPQESNEISERNMKMWEEIFKAESEDKE